MFTQKPLYTKPEAKVSTPEAPAASPSTPVIQPDDALYHAARNGHVDEAKALIDGKADVNRAMGAAYCGDTPLIIAAFNGNLGVVKLLLAADGIRIDQARSSGDCATPLGAATFNGHYEVAKALIEQKADVNKTVSNENAPLHLVTQKCFVNLVQLLLDHKASVNAVTTDDDGVTPLFTAVRKNHPAIVGLLLAAGANPELTTKRGHTPLEWARKRHYDDINALFKSGSGSSSDLEDKKGSNTLSTGIPPRQSDEYRVFTTGGMSLLPPTPAPAQAPASAPAQAPASAPAQAPASAPAQAPASATYR